MSPSKRTLVAAFLTTRRGIATLVVLTCITYVLLRSSPSTSAFDDATRSIHRGAVPERWKESWAAGASRTAALGVPAEQAETPSSEQAGVDVEERERQPTQVWTKVEMEELLDHEIGLLQQDEGNGPAYHAAAAEDNDEVPRVDGLWRAAERKPLNLGNMKRPPPPPSQPDRSSSSSSHASHESILSASSSDSDAFSSSDADDGASEPYDEYTADYLSTPLASAPSPPAPLPLDSDGATPSPDFSPEQEAEADAPSAAANDLEAAVDRAPMAALLLPGRSAAAAKAEHDDEHDDAADAARKKNNNNKSTTSKHTAANLDGTKDERGAGTSTSDSSSDKDKSSSKEDQVAAADRDRAAARSKPQKIGTGRRVVVPNLGALDVDGAPAPNRGLPVPQRVGAGAKAGAVVQEEAGKRVGTGARPGAKGMKLVVAPEERRRVRL
ncbi:hypothetical protein JCM1840_005930 [Sporobolomyces johnsonii]